MPIMTPHPQPEEARCNDEFEKDTVNAESVEIPGISDEDSRKPQPAAISTNITAPSVSTDLDTRKSHHEPSDKPCSSELIEGQNTSVEGGAIDAGIHEGEHSGETVNAEHSRDDDENMHCAKVSNGPPSELKDKTSHEKDSRNGIELAEDLAPAAENSVLSNDGSQYAMGTSISAIDKDAECKRPGVLLSSCDGTDKDETLATTTVTETVLPDDIKRQTNEGVVSPKDENSPNESSSTAPQVSPASLSATPGKVNPKALQPVTVFTNKTRPFGKILGIDERSIDAITNRYKVNGIIRRPCICANSEECRIMTAFWCEAVDDDLNCRDIYRAGYIRLPIYQPDPTSPVQFYKNALRLSYLEHLRPPGSSPSARWLATTRRQGKNTAEFVALHHFPREFLKKSGKGLKIEYLEDGMAENYKLKETDKIHAEGHPLHNHYFAPPCYEWSDLLREYQAALATTAIKMGKQISDPLSGSRSSKPKILCLGMSKACVETQMDDEGYYWNLLENTSPTVDQAVELVRRNILTEMDGRDLARCRAMEERHKVDCYTVSQETGAKYDPLYHLNANFNRGNFCQALERSFDKPVFRQIILDYFWIPSGTWMNHHWSKSFFHITLPNFVKRGLLEYPPESQYGAKPASTRKLGYGVVYLPFCFHCMKHLIASIDEISKYYKIEFVYKNELEEHALWSGTSTIDANEMQHFFGKNIAQEEVYCTFAPRDVFEAMEDARITKEDVISVLRGIEDFEEVRMIRLTPLSRHNPRFKRTKQYADESEFGGFVGLLPPEDVERGFDSLLPASKVTSSSSEEESGEDFSSEDEVVETPCIRKKPIVRRKKQVKEKEASLLGSPASDKLKRKRKRMFEVLPDLETYDSLGGSQGNEETADRYALPERIRRRPRCDVATYHFGPELTPEQYEARAMPRPSLMSKLSLAFVSGYDERIARLGGEPGTAVIHANDAAKHQGNLLKACYSSRPSLMSKLTLAFVSGYDERIPRLGGEPGTAVIHANDAAKHQGSLLKARSSSIASGDDSNLSSDAIPFCTQGDVSYYWSLPTIARKKDYAVKRGIEANQEWTISVGDLVALEHDDSARPNYTTMPWYPFRKPWSPAQILALSRNGNEEEEGYMVHVRWLYRCDDFEDLEGNASKEVYARLEKDADSDLGPKIVYEFAAFSVTNLDTVLGRVVLTSDNPPTESFLSTVQGEDGIPQAPLICQTAISEDYKTITPIDDWSMTSTSGTCQLKRGITDCLEDDEDEGLRQATLARLKSSERYDALSLAKDEKTSLAKTSLDTPIDDGGNLESTDTVESYRGYLMMLAHMAEMPGVQVDSSKTIGGVESYASILRTSHSNNV